MLIKLVSVCAVNNHTDSLVVNETDIPEEKYLHETTLHCKEGYRTKTKDDNTVMTWKVTCDSEGNWSPLLGCEKKGTVPFYACCA